MYPLCVIDAGVPIYNPKVGQTVGSLKIRLQLGSPLQVNRQIAQDQERERTRVDAMVAAEKNKI
jgi:hypothetical protein